METVSYSFTIKNECVEQFSIYDILILTASIFDLAGKLVYLKIVDFPVEKSLYLQSAPNSVIRTELRTGNPGYRIGTIDVGAIHLDWGQALTYYVFPSKPDKERKMITYSNILVRTLLGGA